MNYLVFEETAYDGYSMSPENQIVPKYLGYLNTSLKV